MLVVGDYKLSSSKFFLLFLQSNLTIKVVLPHLLIFCRCPENLFNVFILWQYYAISSKYLNQHLDLLSQELQVGENVKVK